MMYKVTRRFTFEAAHRLPSHKGRCKHLHGHSYVAIVELESPTLNEHYMVMDFAAIDKIVGGWIGEHWDHSCLLSADDWLAQHLIHERVPVHLFAEEPTAEVMARCLFNVCRDRLSGSGVYICSVAVYETADCFATVTNK